MTTTALTNTTGTRDSWRTARLALLEREKELTRLRDELAAERRALPWVRVDEEYVFDTPAGTKGLAELFDGRSQLLVYHFMLGPDWEEGCPSCSFWADNFDGIGVHLEHRDVRMIVVSRAPLERIEAYRRRMGWSFPWVSSVDNDFNFDYGVSFTPEQQESRAEYNYRVVDAPFEEMPGLSAFALVDGVVFHTYSCYARGLDAFNGAYQLLDLAPRGRDEDGLPWTMAWLRRHDAYEEVAAPAS
jgi:predicted dithiol-disulfide oxidoreductase (DUF899 family)